MNALLLIVGVVAIVLLFVGGFTQSLNWLLWAGVILLILAAIGWIVRTVSGRTPST
ncbi:hypothetical protein [Arthrobacter sp. 35W]|uniref:hypothetical protein n=1 Tax=Arthrobacter sp. 35W TaxID=1132441 RepID=UPI00040F5A99|nr:hypothetical protein [Arthrobacter sp. 35W]